ncbi:Uncharacterized conserved protein, DUF58 family, contains vWF domain [Tenacibaculum sp. MAR_2009_124]|uniref:DUF58 domain-containing protein n=1 Tax=Tenacibaculum sp. MAR_2009_124 TaxID=1250059 RepID=UPI00089AC102|nr:DUF58 domain-containing protein [Tenacibaculum sp. MAR_2009_124]SEB42162.1 Uncharacterized conserved protein, DUF58 family, contains vWF domain [Tenacibaculum sp. MAR_2009_124]
MSKLYHSLFLNNRFFYCLTVVAVVFVLGFFIPILFNVSKIVLFAISIITFIDIILIYSIKEGFEVKRSLPERLSNGDDNKISLEFKNNYGFNTHSIVIEELPFQFQKRNFTFNQLLKPKERKLIHYDLHPVKRGEYHFGHINVYVSSPLQLATKKYILGTAKKIKCYPSFLRLNDFSLKAVSNDLTAHGNKKIRRIGHSLEFEQIKEYVSGDDIRTLNWKATAKRNQLMVNQYIEEKSQPVYSIIDKGRPMQMHFNNLSLLDYAINATLAVSNIILRKQDKAGMLTFSKKIENLIVAEQRTSQMNLISEALYNVSTNFLEADYSLLYASIKRKITSRSLLILYTNFETLDALKRQLPYLRAIAKNHLLLVVFFENTELNTLIKQKATTVEDVYDKIIAEKFMYEKKQIANELKKYGIQSVLTKPENLTGNTINKYLELKSRGLF